jgi:4-amino-4-deoxy-L-arabinose transferase-like glycosyltransferase
MTTQGKSKTILLASAVLISFGLLVQFANLRSNPPGFFIDESSIAFNAQSIATTGRDEHGDSWPLFFRAFGEFKNPVYIYLLAGVFRLTGPGILGARSLSAMAGLVTVVLLGLLGARISESRWVGFLFAIFCLLTPWLFELSRLVMEVALYPLAVVLFLIAVWYAAKKPSWNLTQICALTATLTLLTYTYSIGRLLAPLLALGLFFFATRKRLAGIIQTGILYVVTLIPVLIFNQHQPQALTGRFRALTYLSSRISVIENAFEFVKHFVRNLNPWRLFVTESSQVSEIVHIPGWPALLTVTALLISTSIILVIRSRRPRTWWCFIAYGAIVSIVPASLTADEFHMLRLAAFPVFLLLMTIPTFQWLIESDVWTKRIALIVTMLLIVTHGLLFQWRYHASASAPRRLHTFDADYPAKIWPAALANAGTQPVYLADAASRPGYIQAFWYATLQGIPLSNFISLGFDKSAPEGAVVITTEQRCQRCKVLAESEPYVTYKALGQPPVLTRLPDEGMKGELYVRDCPERLLSGHQIVLNVIVKNVSESLWFAGDRIASPFQVSVGNHWLDSNGKMIVHDDGRSALQRNLSPGETLVIPLTINAPKQPGEYLVEIDLLQEDVSWFGLKGSQTWRGRVVVSD